MYCKHCYFFVLDEKNADSKSVCEGKSSNQRRILQEQPKSHVNKEQSDEGSEDAAAAAVERKQLRGTVKDASERYDADWNKRWLPGLNLSSLTQLTGAVTSTVMSFCYKIIFFVVIIKLCTRCSMPIVWMLSLIREALFDFLTI